MACSCSMQAATWRQRDARWRSTQASRLTLVTFTLSSASTATRPTSDATNSSHSVYFISEGLRCSRRRMTSCLIIVCCPLAASRSTELDCGGAPVELHSKHSLLSKLHSCMSTEPCCAGASMVKRRAAVCQLHRRKPTADATSPVVQSSWSCSRGPPNAACKLLHIGLTSERSATPSETKDVADPAALSRQQQSQPQTLLALAVAWRPQQLLLHAGCWL